MHPQDKLRYGKNLILISKLKFWLYSKFYLKKKTIILNFFFLNSTYQINQTMNLVHEFDSNLKQGLEYGQTLNNLKKSSRFYQQFNLI